ncbi:MAG: hypothetical protein Q9226_000430 [Calogaya cf. arnoldii]
MLNTLFDPLVFTTLILHVVLSTVVAAAVPRCWDPEVSAKSLVFRECNEIIVNQIGLTYDRSRRPFNPSLPLIFSRDPVPQPDIRTPKTWFNEEDVDSSCLIGVDIPSYRGGSDKTSLHDIKMAAMAIAVECVIKRQHLGGILQIGWAHKINVVITSLSQSRNVREGKTGLNGTLEEA